MVPIIKVAKMTTSFSALYLVQKKIHSEFVDISDP